MQRFMRVGITLTLLSLLIMTPGRAARGAVLPWPSVGPGMSGPNVVALQYLLQAHGYNVGVSGTVDPQTVDAVKRFQTALHLPATGNVGAATWPLLVMQVQYGSSGPAVNALQSELNAASSVHLTVDGIFANATLTAVLAFQRAHGLYPSGIAGILTWNQLVALAGGITVTPVPTPASHAALTVAPQTISRGGVITVSGSGFAPGETVLIFFRAVPAMVTTARASGTGLLAATDMPVPYILSSGSQTVVALGAASKRTALAAIVVQAPTPAISLSATTARPGDAVTVTGQGFSAREQVTISLNGAAVPTQPTIVTTANGRFSATFTVPGGLFEGSNTVSAIGNVSRVAAIAPLTGMLPVASRFYFAGGVNTATEHSSVRLLNTNAAQAQVRLTFFFGSGATDTKLVTVAARSAQVIPVASLEPFQGPFGLDVEANRRIASEITIARDGKDGDTLLGNPSLGTTWYMAEGYTGLTFHETVSILNPDFNAPAHLHLQLLPFGGRASKTVAVTVPPHSDYLADINSQMPHQSLSIVATSDRPVAMGRTLTFSSDGFGMTTRAGTNTAATSWVFAEGTTTTRFQTFLTVLNPNSAPTQVTASFFGSAGTTLGSRTLVVAGLSRANIKLNDIVHASGIATVVSSNLPVVVERPEYFGSPNSARVAGSDAFGRNGAGVSWTFPGGDTENKSEFLLLYNPSPRAVAITAIAYGDDGSDRTRTVVVAPTARTTVDVNTFFAGLTPHHGIWLQATNGLGFVAEQTVFTRDFSSLASTEGIGA